MSRVSIIAAIARDNVIGLDNTLPWHLPEDLKRFRALTMGHHIIMGRKTFESLGRLLPGRTTVIVSRNPDYEVEGAVVAGSLSEAVAACGADPEIFVIGGAQLYREALTLADRLHLTEIDADFRGDARFPAFDHAAWSLVQSEQHVSSEGWDFRYATYDRA